MNAWPGRSVPCKVLRPASPRLSSPVFLPREEKNASPRVRRFSLATPAHSLLTLPPYFLLSLSRYIPLSVETLRATSPFGYVRDASNVSVWIVSGYVGDVARYVSTGWWNRERPGTLCSCVMDDELGLRIHLLLSRPIVGNTSRWVGSRQSTSLCVIYYN